MTDLPEPQVAPEETGTAVKGNNGRYSLIWDWDVTYLNPEGEEKTKRFHCSERYLREYLGLLETTGGCKVIRTVTAHNADREPVKEDPETVARKNELREAILKQAGHFD